MPTAEGTRRTTTPTIDGLAVGVATRRAAEAAGVPVPYWIRTRELGWIWAAVRDGTPHLVPPDGELAECGRLLRRDERSPTTSGIAATACDRCWRRVLGDTPRRTRS